MTFRYYVVDDDGTVKGAQDVDEILQFTEFLIIDSQTGTERTGRGWTKIEEMLIEESDDDELDLEEDEDEEEDDEYEND